MPGCSLWGRRRGRLYDRRGRQPAATVRGPRNDADGCLNDTCQAGSQSDHKNKCLVNLLSRPYSRSEPGDVRGTSSPREGQVFDFLPPFLKRLYRSLRVPYARGTRVRETPEPEPEIAVSMRERMFRVEIIQDAFCERRPRPQRLFRKPTGGIATSIPGATWRPPATPPRGTAAPTAPTQATSTGVPTEATGRPKSACTGWPPAPRCVCSPSAAPGPRPGAISAPPAPPSRGRRR